MSSTPFCAGQGQWVDTADVWSNAQSVFALVDSTVYQNSGSGWSPLFESSTTFGDLTGFADGPLVLTARSASRCGILFLDGDGLRCSGAAQNVYRVFTVDRRLAYSVANGRLLVYRGDFWTQAGGVLALTGTYGGSLWADAQQAIVSGGSGEVFRYDLESDSASALPPYSDSAEALALWGFGPDDLWLATDAAELLHYDGNGWQFFLSLQDTDGNIRGMWGQDGVLYFHTATTVFRAQGNRIERILSLPPDDWQSRSVRSLWGNSPSEVFIAIQNYRIDAVVHPDGQIEHVASPADSCGAIRLLYFDGERVGQL